MRRMTSKRMPLFTESGVLLVDKPADWTSFDVVNFVRSRFNIPKVGHCGTLDPAATGLLVLVLGDFTRLSGQLSGTDKVYRATLELGVETDSEDLTGTVLARRDWSGVTETRVREVLASFLGRRQQTPPMVSAVKQGGKRLYELARKGIEVERESREIEIFELSVEAVALPCVDFTLRCSKGTYVRTLCADAGRKLGCGGALKTLRRLACGPFRLEEAVTIETVKTWEPADLAIRLRQTLAAASAAAGRL